MEYDLVMSTSQSPAEAVEKFRERMDAKIAKGWVPQGGVCVAPFPDLQAYSISQAIIRVAAASTTVNG
jgi:hypothetical protein